MIVIKIPHECLDAAGLKLRSINTSESTIRVAECDKGGRCIFDKYREKYPVIQEFEKPEYCPLKRQERSDNNDGE